MATFGWTGTGLGMSANSELPLHVTGNAQFDHEVTFARFGSPVFVQRVGFNVTAGGAAGTHTGSVSLPAGALLIDILIHAVAVWNAGTSAVMIVGDEDDPNGFFDDVNMKATDLAATESINFDRTGGQEGADLTGTATHWNRRYLATARVITGVITLVGTAATTGETYMDVVYSLPAAPDTITATFVAT